MIAPHLAEILLICFLAVLVGGPYILYLRRDRLGFQKTRANLKRLQQKKATAVPPNPDDYHHAIAFDSQGFNVTDLRSRKKEPVAKSWSGICLVTAFKRDLFTVDCICLHFADADGTVVELNEEMAGWNRLVDALPTLLPGCKPQSEWYFAVAFPAFTANPTQIYHRTPETEPSK
jgi:hypothetical protein